MADGVWFDSRVKRICKIPDLQPRQASATQAFTIGNDRKDGSVLQAGDDDREIYPRLRFQLTGLEKINYVTRVEYSQSDNYQVIALKVFYPPKK